MGTPNAQWQQSRIPPDFSPAAKRWAQGLHDTLDEIYQRYGRLGLNELSGEVRKIISDAQGNTAELAATASRIMMAVSGGSSVFTGETAPDNPVYGDLWFDSSVTPPITKRFEDGVWVDTGFVSVIDRLGTIAAMIISPEEIVSHVTSSEIYRTDLSGKADASDLSGLATVDYVNELNTTEIAQRDNAINISVTNEKTRAQQVENAIKEFTEVAKTYFKFDIDGLTIGKPGSPFETMIDNTQMSFKQDGAIVAYIKYDKLFIYDAEIINLLTIGNPEEGYTDLNAVPNGIRASWRAT